MSRQKREGRAARGIKSAVVDRHAEEVQKQKESGQGGTYTRRLFCPLCSAPCIRRRRLLGLRRIFLGGCLARSLLAPRPPAFPAPLPPEEEEEEDAALPLP